MRDCRPSQVTETLTFLFLFWLRSLNIQQLGDKTDISTQYLRGFYNYSEYLTFFERRPACIP